METIETVIQISGLSCSYVSVAIYTAKNHELLKVQNRIEQCCAAHIVQCCQ